MRSARTIIKDGVIITSNDTFRGTLIIENERISGIVKDIIISDEDLVIDAQGLFVMPGVIDVNTDFNSVYGKKKSLDSFLSGSRSAVSGGVTTIIDYCVQKKSESLVDTLQRKIEQASKESYCDFSFHAVISKLNPSILEEMFQLVNAGVPSFKFFLANENPSLVVNDYYLFAALNEAQKYGALIGIHSENSSIIRYLTEKFQKENKLTPDYHFKASPNFAEYEGINKALIFNEVARSNLYIFSVSTREGLIPIILSRGMGMRVFSETNLHYLVFDNSRYYDENGADYIVDPPLRSEEDCVNLWDALKMGNIDIVSSAHRAFDRSEMKDKPFYEIPSGIAGVEYLLPVLHTEGVLKGRISLNKMVSLLSSNPARIMGLYPEKGDIQVGAHADLVLFDPEENWFAGDGEKGKTHSIYNGMPLQGRVKRTFIRGNEIYREGKFLHKKNSGEFVKRVPQE